MDVQAYDPLSAHHLLHNTLQKRLHALGTCAEIAQTARLP